MPAADRTGTRPTEKPPALSETEAWLAAAQQIPAIDPASVENLAERARELAEKAPEQQYDHSSLEAADTLRAQTADALQSLAGNMEKAADSLSPIADHQTALSDGQLNSLADNLSTALSAMKEGGLTANPELARQLAGLGNASGLGQLSAAQASQLAQRLGAGAGAIHGIPGANGAGARIAGGNGPGQGSGSGRGNGRGRGPGLGKGPGAGGLGGGGRHGATGIQRSANRGESGPAPNDGRQRPRARRLGDKIDTQRSAPDQVDPSKSAGPTAAGAVAAPASGGDAVWVDQLSPNERAVLKDFFK